MSDNFESSLINLGELSKPATVLVEKISDAVGGIFKPYQIVRVAKAEAQADRVRAEGQIEISDLQRRAFHRFLEEEAKKQKNIEDITQKALPLLNEDSKPNEVEDDWITHFFDRCRLISDDEMQGFWSRALAGEANSPGRFSKRTLSFLTSLDKFEAGNFTALCAFVLNTYGTLVPFIYIGHLSMRDIYVKNGIDEYILEEMESIGLVHLTDGQFETEIIPNRTSYFGKTITVKSKYEGPAMPGFPAGRVRLTKLGEELAPICGAKPVEGFLELMVDHWKANDWISA